MPVFRCLLSVLLVIIVWPAYAAEQMKQPRVCLVLSGGGARGAAHVGVLKALEELRVPIDCIVGTSAGAAIGGLYAAGLSPDEIGLFLRQMDWDKALRDGPVRANLSYRRKQDDAQYLLRLEFGYSKGRLQFPKGFTAGRNLDFLLKTELLRVADIQNFDALPIPFRAIATDLETGDMMVLKEGDLATALRASMAVPGIFAPVEINNRLLVDGGLVRNLPVDVARAMGADVVIAVNVGSPLAGREELTNVIGLSLQVINILTEQNVAESVQELTGQDILIDPDLTAIAPDSFDRVEQAMVIGARATRNVASRLQALSISANDYWRFLDNQRTTSKTLPVIDYVEVQNNEFVSTRRILGRIETRAGQQLDMKVLEDDLQKIYEMGEFERVSFAILGKDENASLLINTRERDWGPHYLRVGLQFVEDFEGGSNYRLILGHVRSNLNPLGGELKNQVQIGKTRRLYSEFFQPITYAGQYFIAPQVEYKSETFDLFAANTSDRYAEYRGKVAQGIVDIGRLFGNAGELRLGLKRGEARSEPRVGAPGLPAFENDIGAWRLKAGIDLLDQPHFPRSGLHATLEMDAARENLGASFEYDRLYASAGFATSFGRSTLLFTGEYGSSFGTALPLYQQFTLGGFASLAGLREDQLRGDEMAVVRAIYYARVYDLPAVAGNGIYLGGSMEAGAMWQAPERFSVTDLEPGVSLFAGADTIVGPAYLAIGINRDGDSAIYFSIGRSF